MEEGYDFMSDKVSECLEALESLLDDDEVPDRYRKVLHAYKWEPRGGPASRAWLNRRAESDAAGCSFTASPKDLDWTVRVCQPTYDGASFPV